MRYLIILPIILLLCCKPTRGYTIWFS